MHLTHTTFDIRRYLSAALLLAALAPLSSYGALPSQQAPSRGEGSSWLQTIQNYGYDLGMLIGLSLCAFALTVVARHGIGTYHEIHDGKKKWSDLGATVGVGVVMVLLCIFFVTKATGIM